MHWPTHEVSNQAPELHGYNLFASDAALCEGVRQEHAQWHEAALTRLGAALGCEEMLLLGVQANHHPPELNAYDRFGRRIDVVEFHPGWHRLLSSLRSQALHALS